MLVITNCIELRFVVMGQPLFFGDGLAIITLKGAMLHFI